MKLVCAINFSCAVWMIGFLGLVSVGTAAMIVVTGSGSSIQDNDGQCSPVEAITVASNSATSRTTSGVYIYNSGPGGPRHFQIQVKLPIGVGIRIPELASNHN